MQAKAFEVRDRATCFCAVAVKIEPANAAEFNIMRRAGFESVKTPTGENWILFGPLYGGSFHYDKFEVAGNSTRFTALEYIAAHFDELTPGQVICTEYIRGERDTPKESELST